jgi:hypothetical protein
MNLHGIVAPTVGAVNPLTSAAVQISTGYTTSADGTVTPSYSNLTVLVQVQALTSTEMDQLDGLNLQGVKRAVYTPGWLNGMIRVDSKGGDVMSFAEYPGGRFGSGCAPWFLRPGPTGRR